MPCTSTTWYNDIAVTGETSFTAGASSGASATDTASSILPPNPGPGIPGGAGPNYPGGYTVFGNETFETDFLPDGWYGYRCFNSPSACNAGEGRVAFDATLGRNVGEVVFKQGAEVGGGGAPRTGRLNGFAGAVVGYRRVYQRMLYRYMPGFNTDRNPAGIHKIVYHTAERTGGQVNYIMGCYGFHQDYDSIWNGIRLVPGIGLQGGSAGNPALIDMGYSNGYFYAPPNQGSTAFKQSVTFQDNAWHEIEWLVDVGDADTANGWFKMWWDGTLSHDYTGIQFGTSDAGAPRHRFCRWEPIHGGGDYTVSKDISQRCAAYFMAGINP